MTQKDNNLVAGLLLGGIVVYLLRKRIGLMAAGGGSGMGVAPRTSTACCDGCGDANAYTAPAVSTLGNFAQGNGPAPILTPLVWPTTSSLGYLSGWGKGGLDPEYLGFVSPKTAILVPTSTWAKG